MASYTVRELKHLLTPFSFYHKWFNHLAALKGGGDTRLVYMPEAWFELMGGALEELKCVLSQQDLLNILGTLHIRPRNGAKRSKFDRALLKRQTALLQEPNRNMLDVNCELLAHYLPSLRTLLREASGIRLRRNIVSEGALEQLHILFKDDAKSRAALLKTSQRAKKVHEQRVLLSFGSRGAVTLTKRKGSLVKREYRNRAFQTFNAARFLKLLNTIQFPYAIKRLLLHNVVKGFPSDDPNAMVDRFNANVGKLLGLTYRRSGMYIDRAFGAGVFGITFGVRIPGKPPRALKIVVEEDMQMFRQETRLHRAFAQAGMAPKMYNPVYVSRKRFNKKVVMAYTMDRIDGVVDQVFSTRLPYPESLQLVQQTGANLVHLVRETAARQLCHGDMHGGNVACINPSTKQLEKLLLIDFGWSANLSKYHKQRKTKNKWPFVDYPLGGWPMYDILQFLRGGVLDICEELEKPNLSKWMRENYRKPFNRLLVVCSMFAESFVHDFRKWIMAQSRRRFSAALRSVFARPRTKAEPSDTHKQPFFRKQCRSEKDLLACCKKFAETYNQLKKLKKNKAKYPLVGALDILDRLFEFLDGMFNRYVKYYRKII